MDFCRNKAEMETPCVKNEEVEITTSYKYLGVAVVGSSSTLCRSKRPTKITSCKNTENSKSQ